MDCDYTWFLGRKMCNTGTSSGKVARYNRDAFKLLYGTDDEFQPGTDVDVAKIYYQQITYKSWSSINKCHVKPDYGFSKLYYGNFHSI